MKMVDLTGERFGRLLVVRRADGRQRPQRIAWICVCDCGRETAPITGSNLRSGQSRSCGCLQAESRATSQLKHGHARGGRKSPEYESWLAMIKRCEYKDHKHYRHYGGRGITVCPQWRASFSQFLDDVGPRPGLEYSIDRIDNNGNYEPGNVRWATRSEQSRNRRPMVRSLAEEGQQQ